MFGGGKAAVEAIRMADEAKGLAAAASQAAQNSLAEIQKHAEVCSQRQGAIVKDLQEIKDFVKRAIWALLAGAAVLCYNTLKSHGVMP